MYKDNYPSQLLENAVEAISSLPGVGRRSALRLALHLLRQDPQNVHHFTEAVNALRDKVCYCNICGMISDTPVCRICSQTGRRTDQICVVESVQDVMSIENTAQYNGLYHVLGGIISPINGVGPSDLNISSLAGRLCEGTEVIMALPGDVEGETTAFYIYRQIQHTGARVTAIARGLGFSDGLQYADAATLGRSIAARTPFRIQ